MKNDDLRNDREKIDNYMQKMFSSSKNFKALDVRKETLTPRNSAMIRRNNIIAWSTIAASLLLVVSFVLPMLIDVTAKNRDGAPATGDLILEAQTTEAGLNAADTVGHIDQTVIFEDHYPYTEPVAPSELEKNDELYVPAPISGFADVKIRGLTENGKSEVSFREYGERIDGKDPLKAIQNSDITLNPFSNAYEMDIELDTDEDIQVTIETRVYYSWDLYNTVRRVDDTVTLKNGKGTYFASTMSSMECPASFQKIYCVIMTCNDETVTYTWNESQETFGYDYDKNSVNTAAPENDPVWTENGFYTEIFSYTDNEMYIAEMDSDNNAPSYSMDIMVYVSPENTAKTARIDLHTYIDGGLYHSMSLDVDISSERRGGVGITMPRYISNETKSYGLYVTVGEETRAYFWTESGPFSEKGTGSKYDIVKITASGKDITENVFYAIYADVEMVLKEMTASHDPLKPSTEVIAQVEFEKGKTNSVSATLQLFDMDRSSVDFMRTTGIYYLSNYDRNETKTFEFKDIPKLGEDECRGYVLTFVSDNFAKHYIWYESGENFDLSQFDGLVTEQTDMR